MPDVTTAAFLDAGGATIAHPARFSKPIMEFMKVQLETEYGTLLDPFAGTGRIHELGHDFLRTVGVEIEPEWASMHPRTIVGDATSLPFPNQSFDVAFTSVTYGNRMADHHVAKDDSKRNTYTHTLGRQLHDNNSGKMQWGQEYRDLHVKAYRELHRVIRDYGGFYLNISNHIRKGKEIDVTGWHLDTLAGMGYIQNWVYPISTRRNRQGQNGNLRVEHEYIACFTRF